MKTYEGSCHCGEITFTFKCNPIIKGLRCNCSICTRKGALMSADLIAKDQLEIHTGQEFLTLYQFETEVAKHYFCKNCGIYPFHETRRKPEYLRINLGCVNDMNTFTLEYEVFDGRSL